jgi:hypothetical protein
VEAVEHGIRGFSELRHARHISCIIGGEVQTRERDVEPIGSAARAEAGLRFVPRIVARQSIQVITIQGVKITNAT